jgi:ATP-binding cassette, subfamily B, bacterial IrtB/YbtQ
MLKTFVRLLGEDAPTLRRYAAMAVFYGLLSGLTLITLVPVIRHLLFGDLAGAGRWLLVLLIGVTACALWRRALCKGRGNASAITWRACRWAGSARKTARGSAT